MAKKSSRPAIPVELTEEQSAKYLARYIKPGQRGPEIKIPIWRVLNYVLVLLHTGCQWHKLPIKQDDSGKPEISCWSQRKSAETSQLKVKIFNKKNRGNFTLKPAT